MTPWRTCFLALGLGCVVACSAGAKSPAPTTIADPAGGSGTPTVSAPRSPVSVRLPAAPYPGGRVDLRELVVSDGSPSVEAIASELVAEGVPFTKVQLTEGESHRVV